jgi:hypothetical protein
VRIIIILYSLPENRLTSFSHGSLGFITLIVGKSRQCQGFIKQSAVKTCCLS